MAERVVVAMSGGVDSSVAAALLVEQGYEVIGVMLRLWVEHLPPQPPALRGRGEIDSPPLAGEGLGVGSPLAGEGLGVGSALAGEELGVGSARPGEGFNRCCSLESIHDARSVADKLGIPFYVINAEAPFKREVVDPFIADYSAGLTPNPCLACNRRIRFGFLLDYARSLDAAYLATGHYARIRRDATGRFQLLRGADRAKDQSYVLSVLTQADLARVLFPVGEHTKPEVRALAAARGLPTAGRADSQDLCFVADGDYRRFLADHAPEAVQPGPILDRAGQRLGTHRGLAAYTIGQRSGLGIAAPQPLYVLALDVAHNALVVGTAAELGSHWLRAGPVNWVAGGPPAGPIRAEAQIRYRARPAAAWVTPLPDGAAEVTFDAAVRDAAPGQAVVFYDGAICLGGGVIVETRAATKAQGFSMLAKERTA